MDEEIILEHSTKSNNFIFSKDDELSIVLGFFTNKENEELVKLQAFYNNSGIQGKARRTLLEMLKELVEKKICKHEQKIKLEMMPSSGKEGLAKLKETYQKLGFTCEDKNNSCESTVGKVIESIQSWEESLKQDNDLNLESKQTYNIPGGKRRSRRKSRRKSRKKSRKSKKSKRKSHRRGRRKTRKTKK